MFTVKLQSPPATKRDVWHTIKSVTVAAFALSIAEKAISKARELGASVSFIIGKDDEVPSGWRVQSTFASGDRSIWSASLTPVSSESDALAALDALD